MASKPYPATGLPGPLQPGEYYEPTVIFASDGSIISSFAPPATTTVTAPAAITDSATVVTLLAANAARLGGVIYNDSTSILRVKFGSGASASSFHYALVGKAGASPGGTLEIPFKYTGIITGIWDTAAGGSAKVGEFS